MGDSYRVPNPPSLFVRARALSPSRVLRGLLEPPPSPVRVEIPC